MAGMKFNADIDLEKIVKLRKEIDKLKKSLIEIASVPNSDAAVKALEKQLASALKKLEKYKDKYVQTQQARIDQEKAASEQIKKQQKEIDSLIKKYEALQKQIEKGTVRAPRSPKTYTDDQISVALKTQVQSIKEAREQLKVLRFAQANVTDQQERETGARTKLNIKIQENTRYLKLNSDAYTRQKMEIGNYEENIRRALDGTGQFNLSLSKMLGVIGGTAALKGLVTDMINVRGEFQKTSIAFETMLGSKEKADALMAQMVETAAKTPFDLQGVTSGAKQLLAYGTSADKVNETLVRLGNIASGLSIPLGDLVYLYGTSMSQGRLFTQDVNQFMGRGIPLVAELSKELGKTESEIRKMVTEGKVGFPELQKVIENMTNEGGKFYNLMEMQSTTLSGQISNLGDAWDSMLNSIGEDTQGIASMTISAVTSIIENYKEVGAIIASLVATYGTYKAAIVVVNMLERANIMILRQAVVEKKLAAAANIVLSNSMAIAAARGKIFATVQKNIISTFKGVGKALANPYVLFAAAVGTATYGLYKFYTRETEVEKMQKRYNETKEAAARREEQHKTKVEELIASIEDETKAEMERVGAMDLLKKMYPGIIEKYIDEEGHLKNLIALKKELSEADATRKAEENKTELRSYDERIKNQKEYIERMRTNDQSAFDDEIAKLKRLEEEREVSRQKVASDYINKLIADSRSKSDEELKNTIDTYKKLLSENVQGEWFSGSKDFKVGEIKQFVSALEDLQKARLNAVQNKEYWESKKKQAEDARDALDVSKKNSEEWNKYTQQIQEAQKQIDKYSDSKSGKEADKQKKDQKKLAEDLLSLRRQNQQAEIDLMEEGTEKKLKQIDLDYQKELDAIKKQEKDLSERQGGKLTSEQSIEISARYTNAENKREKDIADVSKELNSILDKYRDYSAQRIAIEKQYQDDEKKLRDGLAKAKSDSEKKQYEDALKELEKQRKKTIDSISKSEIEDSGIWKMLMGDVDALPTDTLEKLLSDAEQLVKSTNLSATDMKAMMDTINSARQNLVARNPFKTLKEEYEKYQKAIKKGDKQGAFTSWSNVEQASESIKSNISTLGASLSSLGTTFSDELGEGIQKAVDIINDGITAFEVFGKTGEKSAGDTVKGISGIVGIITTLVGTVMNAFDSTKAEQERNIEYQRRQEGYWDSINYQVERYLELLKEAAGNDYFATATQSLTTLEKAREKSYKDIVKSMPVGDVDYTTFGLAQLFNYGKFSHAMTEYAFGGPQAKEIFDFIQANGGYDLENKLISEEAIWAMKSNADIWSKLPEWLQQAIDKFVEFNDQTKELEETLNEDLFQTTSQGLEEAILEGLKGGKRGIADFGEDFEEIMRNALLQSFVIDQLRGKAQEFYKKYTLLADSDENGKLDLTAEEISDLRKDWNDIIRAATEEAKNIDAIVGGSSSSSQEASKKGFATASQDSIDELNGRFTALQIAGEEIKNQNQLQTMSILELRADMLPIIANTTGIKDIASETRDLLRLSYEAIVDIRDNTNVIVKPIQQMASDIAEVKRNTNGLSKR